MIRQPNACRRPMCAPGFVDAPTRGPVRGSAPAGWEGAAGPGAADGSRGNTSPRGLLAVLRGVVLHEPLDELIDGAGLGQAALAGLVGQLVLGQARVALAGLVVGLLGLLALDPRLGVRYLATLTSRLIKLQGGLVLRAIVDTDAAANNQPDADLSNVRSIA